MDMTSPLFVDMTSRKGLNSNFVVNKLVYLAELYPSDFLWIERLMIRTQFEMYIYDVKKDRAFCDI